jgi:tight adherence protein B
MRYLVQAILGPCLLAVAVVASGGTAHADGAGQIDHVEVAENGTVKMLYSVPGLASGTSPELDSLRVRVAGTPVDATASPLKAGEVERAAILALDVSQSMRGERFAAAKEAALAYLGAAPDDVRIGLVTFAGSVDVVETPTRDHARVEGAVSALGLSAGTMLYDGVLESLAHAGSDGQRQVVVLTDGADTGETPLTHVVAQAQSSGVTVNVVALEQSAANQAKLRQITDATGGDVLPADDPAALAAVFTDEAAALAQQVLIEFQPVHSEEATIAVSLDAAGETYTDSTFVSLAADTPEASRPVDPIPVEAPSRLVDERFLYAGAAALGLGLAVILGLLLMGKPKDKGNLAQRHLDFYASGSGAHGASTGGSPAKPQRDMRGSAVAVADQIVKGGGLEERITKRLTAAGVSLTAAEWLLLHAGIVVVLALLGLLLSGGNPAMIVLLLVCGAIGPWLFLGMKESRRLKAFNSQLAETLQLMSGGLSAGLSLPQAVDTVVREGAEPMSGELHRALIEQRLGVEIEDALDAVGERMQSKDFGWVVMAIRIQREIGGNLAELLNTVAGTIREREYLRRQVRTLSAEGRLSAWILGGLPVVFAIYLALARGGYLAPLYTTFVGWVLSAGALVMLGIGTLWLKSVVKVEV